MENTGKRTEPTQVAASAAAKVAWVLDNDDLLCEIFLRLDFPSCLVRSAAVSKRWLRHASDPAFLRRFRHLHPPRLLGLYVRPVSVASDATRLFPTKPFFVPMPQSPAESAAVIRRGSFEVDRDDCGVWDCRNGLVAFDGCYGEEDKVALFSPLHPMRGLATATLPDLQVPAESVYGRWFHHEFVLLPEDGGDGMSCTAMTLMINRRAARARLSESQAGTWREGRISDTIELPQRSKRCLLPLLAHGKFYMICMAGYILGLDPESLPTMSLFCIKLPDGVEYKDHTNVALCRAEGSGFFLIHVKMSRIHVWTHSTGCSSSSIGNWKLVDSICLRQVFGHLEDPSFKGSQDAVVRVAAAGDNADFVILEIEHKLLCVHIRSRAVEKVRESPTFQPGLEVHPFTMVWPPTFPKWSDGRDLGVE